jgi:hypothetical protein
LSCTCCEITSTIDTVERIRSMSSSAIAMPRIYGDPTPRPAARGRQCCSTES